MALDVSSLPSPEELRTRAAPPAASLPSPEQLRGLRPLAPAGALEKSEQPETAPPTPQQIAAQQALDETPTADRFIVGAGKGLNDLAVGIQQKALKLAAAIGVPNADKAEQRLQAIIDEEKALTEPLIHTTAGALGNFAGTAIPAALVPGAGGLVGAGLVGAATGGLEATATGESELNNALGGGLGGISGHLLGAGLGAGFKTLLKRAQARAAQRALTSAVEKQKLSNAADLELSVPPSLVTDGARVGKALQGLAGGGRTVEEAARGNQPKIQNAIRESFGIPEGVELKKGLDTVIDNAGQAYDDLRAFPEPIVRTSKFAAAIDSLTDRVKALKDFPSLSKNPLVDQLQKELSEPTSISADTAVSLIKQLRALGRANRGSTESEVQNLGSAQLKAASAVEDMVQENLETAGVPELAEDFRHARKIIAQAHDVRNALAPDGTTVDLRKLAASRAKKEIESDDAVGKLARFGADFPAAAAPPVGGTGGPFNVLEYLAQLGLVALKPPLVAAVAARPLARSAINSRLGQKVLLPGGGSSPGLAARALAAGEEISPSLASVGTAVGALQGGQELQLPPLVIHGNGGR